MTDEIECALLGIDVGTSGVRAVAASPTGKLLAEAEAPIRQDHRAAGGIHEQDPDEWWRAVCSLAQRIVQKLKEASGEAELRGVAVTSTSGTLVVTDAEGQPLRPAILYDDARGAEIAEELNQRAASPSVRLGPSFSLVKAAWVERHEPKLWERIRYVLSPADWLSGKLSGDFGISDFTNALKLGYDPETGSWTQTVRAVGMLEFRLPLVRRPGEIAGLVSSRAANETSLPARTPVLAGATDGMASVVASGASACGDANTTLGTTLVWKVLHDGKPAAHGGVYLHLHPGGLWVPGAASNTGLGSIRRPEALPGNSPAELDRLAARYFPTPVVCYMLPGEGERFPFAHPKAMSFVEGRPRDAAESYAAQLQSIAFVERWGYEILASCGVKVGERIFSTGAAAKSPVLSQLRANVLGKTVVLPRYPTAAFGAAILAATGAVFAGNIVQAIQSMSAILETYPPSPQRVPTFDAIYKSFRNACARRGYAAPIP
ncbi:MAG: FGGY-family carbohydrate kinase [Terriglobia bacterium]|jgi:xylulokinase